MTAAAAARPGRVALLDWDNSLHPGFTLGPWLHALARDDHEAAAGRRFDAARAAYDAGTLPYDDFAGLAEELYTALADGRPVAELDALAASFVRSDRLRPGTTDLVAALLARDVRPMLISGAPIEVLRAHATTLGIAPEDVTGWRLAGDGDRYVGRLASGNTARGGSKAAIVAELVAAGATIVLGLGDSSADRPLIEAARIGAWIDPQATDEAARVRWAEAPAGPERTGSLADLATAIAALA
ncbi:MAG: haloacid dehalogenase-like hydrolase [Chloroflexota bacterium]